MIFRLIRLSLAASCALAVSHIGSVLAGTVIGTYTNNEVTLTMTYLNTYQITADGERHRGCL